MAKKITIKDVAKKVGVTATTVSMVINNNPSIPQRTREKVLSAIKELNYYPNIAARSLVYGKTNTIALFADFLYPLFYQQILHGIEHRIAATPYYVLHFSAFREETARDDIFRKILYGNVADGLISLNRIPSAELLVAYRKEKFPLVIIEQDVPGVNSVVCDNFRGGYLATDYLIRKGRRNICCIAALSDDLRGGSDVQVKRIDGYKSALEDHGLSYQPDNVIDIPNFYFDAGKQCYRDVLKKRKAIDAVFSAAGDAIAIGVMHAALGEKVKIPDDLAIIGYDDLEVDSFIHPALTTIRQPGSQMGSKAIEIALRSLDENRENNVHKVVFEPELIERESV
jgi:DNA-binding LacI/PurR family transcriptional regulator